MRHEHENGRLTPLAALVERLAAPLEEQLSRRRVKLWCRRHGLRLLRWRDAKLFEGPSSWTVDHEHYRIQVLDEDGRQRAGYLVFGRWWRRATRAQVLWDEPPPARGLVEREH